MPRVVNHPIREDINLMDGAFYAGDPHEAWTWMRENAPVYYDAQSDVWALCSYADVLAAAKDPKRFSNAEGIRPHQGNIQDSMIDKDDPEHKARRMLVNRGFTPNRIKEKEPEVRKLCDQIIDRVAADGKCDFVWDVAAWLPLLLIGDMLGFDRSKAPELLEWSDDLLRSLSSTASPEQLEKSMLAAIGFREFQLEIIAQRRAAEPAKDLASILVHSDVEGEKLGDETIVMESLLILIGGDETTRHVISGGMLALLRNPDQMARIRTSRNPDGEVPIEVAVEELLRWVTPIKNMNRTATCDIEIGGQTIAKGDQVLLMYPSANRDETQFEDPFSLDVGREDNHHIAFGFGTHFCLGQALARMELVTMFEAVLTRLPDLRLAPDAELPIRDANFVSGLESMKVEFTPIEKVHPEPLDLGPLTNAS